MIRDVAEVLGYMVIASLWVIAACMAIDTAKRMRAARKAALEVTAAIDIVIRESQRV
jgi:hypothetical protein